VRLERLGKLKKIHFIGARTCDLPVCSIMPQRTTLPRTPRGWVCRLQLLLAFASAAISGSESRRTHDHILLSHIRDSPNLEGQAPVFISHRNRVAQLYPQALGSLFVASYYSQGYGGGMRTCLHTEFDVMSIRTLYLYN
jgi:hypothetical protein